MIVADTDVLIDFLRDIQPMATKIEDLLSSGLATTVITVAELGQGARSKKQQADIGELLNALTVLDFKLSAAEQTGKLRRLPIEAGQDIGLADCAIAAICMGDGHLLLTGNQKHFSRIAGLRLAK